MRAAGFTERQAPPGEFGSHWVLIWDGDCGFCRGTVEWVLRLDREGLLMAVPYQECRGWLPDAVLARSDAQAHLRSPDGRYWGGGAVPIRITGLLGHPIIERLLDTPPLRWATGLGYRWVARHRSRLGRWVARGGR